MILCLTYSGNKIMLPIVIFLSCQMRKQNDVLTLFFFKSFCFKQSSNMLCCQIWKFSWKILMMVQLSHYPRVVSQRHFLTVSDKAGIITTHSVPTCCCTPRWPCFPQRSRGVSDLQRSAWHQLFSQKFQFHHKTELENIG